MPQKSLGGQKTQTRKENQKKRLLGGNTFAYAAFGYQFGDKERAKTLSYVCVERGVHTPRTFGCTPAELAASPL
jgi:hypothetical protein